MINELKYYKGQHHKVLVLTDTDKDIRIILREPKVGEISHYKNIMNDPESDKEAGLTYLFGTCMLEGSLQSTTNTMYKQGCDWLVLQCGDITEQDYYKTIGMDTNLLDVVYALSYNAGISVEFLLKLTIDELIKHIVAFERISNRAILATPIPLAALKVDPSIRIHDQYKAMKSGQKTYSLRAADAMRKAIEEGENFRADQ